MLHIYIYIYVYIYIYDISSLRFNIPLNLNLPKYREQVVTQKIPVTKHISINPLNAELNPTCHLLALLGDHHILHVSRIRGKWNKTDFFKIGFIVFYYIMLVQICPRRKLYGRSKQRWRYNTLNNFHHKHVILGNLFRDWLTCVNSTLSAGFIIHSNILVVSVSEKE